MLIGATVTAVLILLSVGIHYEALSLTSNIARRIRLAHRIRVVLGVLAALSAHFLEVIVFAIGWQILLTAGVARLSMESPTFVDVLYFQPRPTRRWATETSSRSATQAFSREAKR